MLPAQRLDISKIAYGGQTIDRIMFADKKVEKHISITHRELYSENIGYNIWGLWITPIRGNELPSAPQLIGAEYTDDTMIASRKTLGVVKDNYFSLNFGNLDRGWSTSLLQSYKLAIVLSIDTTNSTNDLGLACYDFENNPIIIKFADDRFSKYSVFNRYQNDIEFENNTLTIKKVCISDPIVCEIGVQNLLGSLAEEDLRDLEVTVAGLDYHFNNWTKYKVGNEECWNFRQSINKFQYYYNKEKTVENYLQQYGILKNSLNAQTHKHTKVLSFPSDLNYTYVEVDPVSDIIDSIQSAVDNDIEYHLAIKPFNKDFWDNIKQYLKEALVGPNFYIYAFRNSGIDEVQINGVSGGATLGNFLSGSDVEIVNFNLSDPYIVDSGNSLFANAAKLKTINGGKFLFPDDLSNCFLNCKSLEEIPSNLFFWDCNGYNTLLDSFLEGTTRLKSFPISTCDHDGEDRTNSSNTISVSSMNNCFKNSAIKFFGPTLDMTNMIPSRAVNAFDCPNMVDIRIDRLQAGDWDFSKMVNLNEDSIYFLFDGLLQVDTSMDEGKGSLTIPRQWLEKCPDVVDRVNLQKLGWSLIIKDETEGIEST